MTVTVLDDTSKGHCQVQHDVQAIFTLSTTPDRKAPPSPSLWPPRHLRTVATCNFGEMCWSARKGAKSFCNVTDSIRKDTCHDELRRSYIEKGCQRCLQKWRWTSVCCVQRGLTSWSNEEVVEFMRNLRSRYDKSFHLSKAKVQKTDIL
jgi:hypothetical protein